MLFRGCKNRASKQRVISKCQSKITVRDNRHLVRQLSQWIRFQLNSSCSILKDDRKCSSQASQLINSLVLRAGWRIAPISIDGVNETGSPGNEASLTHDMETLQISGLRFQSILLAKTCPSGSKR